MRWTTTRWPCHRRTSPSTTGSWTTYSAGSTRYWGKITTRSTCACKRPRKPRTTRRRAPRKNPRTRTKSSPERGSILLLLYYTFINNITPDIRHNIMSRYILYTITAVTIFSILSLYVIITAHRYLFFFYDVSILFSIHNPIGYFPGPSAIIFLVIILL